MAKNDRFVVKYEDGWAVKKTKAGRSSSVHSTQKEAEKRAKQIVDNLGGGRCVSKAKAQHEDTPTFLDYDTRTESSKRSLRAHCDCHPY